MELLSGRGAPPPAQTLSTLRFRLTDWNFLQHDMVWSTFLGNDCQFCEIFEFGAVRRCINLVHDDLKNSCEMSISIYLQKIVLDKAENEPSKFCCVHPFFDFDWIL